MPARAALAPPGEGSHAGSADAGQLLGSGRDSRHGGRGIGLHAGNERRVRSAQPGRKRPWRKPGGTRGGGRRAADLVDDDAQLERLRRPVAHRRLAAVAIALGAAPLRAAEHGRRRAHGDAVREEKPTRRVVAHPVHLRTAAGAHRTPRVERAAC
eukprot:2552141-Prymnesium_polylepis.2